MWSDFSCDAILSVEAGSDIGEISESCGGDGQWVVEEEAKWPSDSPYLQEEISGDRSDGKCACSYGEVFGESVEEIVEGSVHSDSDEFWHIEEYWFTSFSGT